MAVSSAARPVKGQAAEAAGWSGCTPAAHASSGVPAGQRLVFASIALCSAAKSAAHLISGGLRDVDEMQRDVQRLGCYLDVCFVSRCCQMMEGLLCALPA